MNCLLLGQKHDFNTPGTKLEKSDLNENLIGLYHHAKGLETADISNLYSADLRALVTECLIRESMKRPGAVDLVTRCLEGKNNAIRAMALLLASASDIPEKLKNMPSRPLKPPEPPQEWLNDLDHFEYDISDETFANQVMIPQEKFASGGIIRRAAKSLTKLAANIPPPTTPDPHKYFGRFEKFTKILSSPLGGSGSGSDLEFNSDDDISPPHV